MVVTRRTRKNVQSPPSSPSFSPATPNPTKLRERLISSESLDTLTKLTTQKRFWFVVGLGFGFLFFTLLLAPKAAYHTGLTDRDHLDDFVKDQVVPFVMDRVPSTIKDANSKEVKPGATHNAKWKHPVFLVPGFVTTGLELWEGHECR